MVMATVEFPLVERSNVVAVSALQVGGIGYFHSRFAANTLPENDGVCSGSAHMMLVLHDTT